MLSALDIETMEGIVRCGSQLFGPKPDVIVSKCRHAPVCLARHSIMYVLSTQFGYSHSLIAYFFHCDHSSVCHAIRVTGHRLKYLPEADKQRLKKRIEMLSNRIIEPPTQQRELELLIGEARRILAELREERQANEDGQTVRSLRKRAKR